MNELDRGRIAYFNRIAEGWDARLDTGKMILRLRDQLTEWELPLSGSFLDIGCGTGVLTRALMPILEPTAMVEAIDFSPGMVEQARQNLQDERVSFHVADARELPYEADSFDVVLVFSTMPHIDPMEDGFAEFARVLKTGGVLHVWHLLSREEVNEIHSRVDPSVVTDILPPAAELGEMMENQGYKVSVIQDSSAGYHVIGRLEGKGCSCE